MFGMSFGEILIVAIIAILFLGPDKLPEAMVKIAKLFRSFKKSIHEVKESIEQEVHLEELKEEAISYKQQLEHATLDLKQQINTDYLSDLNDEVREIEEAIATSDTPKKSKKKKKKKREAKSEESSQHKRVNEQEEQRDV